MRVYLRKCVLGLFVLMFLLFLVSYAFIAEVSTQRKNFDVSGLENKIVNLQRRMESQSVGNDNLLEKVHTHLKKTEQSKMDYNGKVSNYDDKVADEQRGAEFIVGNIEPVLPVLVIACDRVTVKRCLNNLVKFRPNKDTFPIIVSQDCGHEPTYEVIKKFTDEDSSITIIKQPDLSEISLPRPKIKFRGYYKIARHFKFALNYVFRKLEYDAVIIVEDDLDISPDFFEYFLGTYPLLNKDPSLWCISAWNDNGKKDVTDMSQPFLLHRTDFFPGLGWLLQKQTWFELEPKWPPAFFDDWLRNPENIGSKACIRPEISRTYSFGKVGVSKGLFFDVHLRNIQLNKNYVEFTKLNLTYLLKENYDNALTSTVYSLPEARADEVMAGLGHGDVRVMYSTAKSFQKSAKKLGLMDDFRSGVPRTAYRGIVSCFIRGRRVYLAPDFEWTSYDPTWG